MRLEKFGKYQLVQRIGIGGMAEVYVARTHGAEGFVKEVVIKRILPQFNEDPEFVTMFINEARLAAKLQHANIVQIYDFDHIDGDYYIAMEFVDGPDLRRVQAAARRRNMAVPQIAAVHVGVEVLKGLHYAHTRTDRGRALEIVHRDISPHNLLLSFSGEVKIADFGIAKVAALHSATRTGMVKGKLTYMSPEQARGDSIDMRADLYSTGLVLWELLARRRAYDEVGSEGELMAAARRGAVAPLAQENADVPQELAEVVNRLLAVDPEVRYPSAAEALADLSRFSGTTDAIEVADYLQALMPASAQRDDRGETALLDKASSVAAASAGAVTQTVESRRISQQGGSSGPMDDPLDSMDEVSHPTDLEPRGAVSVFSPTTVVAWIVIAVLSFGLGMLGVMWWRSSRRPAPVAMASVLVKVPSLGILTVDGVPVGGGEERRIHGQRDQKLRLVLRDEHRVLQRNVVVGREAEVTLQFASRKPARTKAAGISPSAAPSKAASTTHPTIAIGRVPSASMDPAAVSPRPTDPEKAGNNPAVKRPLRPVTPSPRGRQPRILVGKKSLPGDKSGRASAGAFPAPSRPAKGHKSGPPKSSVGRTPRPEGSERKQVRARGKLNVFVSPWAKVIIEGKVKGTTPVRGMDLVAGKHRVTLINSELRKRERVEVSIPKNGEATIRRSW